LYIYKTNKSNPDLLVVVPHWMQSWHCVCWGKSTENSNSRYMSHLWIWKRRLTP